MPAGEVCYSGEHVMRHLVLFAALLSVTPAQAADSPTDLVICNAKTLTLDAKASAAEALAIRDGIFIQVGGNCEVKELVGNKPRVIDAKGRVVIPGLIERQVHAVGVVGGRVVFEGK